MNDDKNPTSFVEIYTRFLGMITDDEYLEFTPQDTVRDLRNLLVYALTKFEFPRVSLDYYFDYDQKPENEVTPDEFILGLVWEDEISNKPIPEVYVEKSSFKSHLTDEEQSIIATLMKLRWVQRQISSVENTRMKYSGPDFKMTSQANHLSKLLALENQITRESNHA